MHHSLDILCHKEFYFIYCEGHKNYLCVCSSGKNVVENMRVNPR